MEELYELKDDLMQTKTGKEYLHLLLDQRESDKKHMSPVMNCNNMMYIIGAIEAMYYTKQINQREYTLFLKYFGL